MSNAHDKLIQPIVGIGIGQCGIRCAVRTMLNNSDDSNNNWVFIDTDPRSKDLLRTKQQLARFVCLPNSSGPGGVASYSWESAYTHGSPLIKAASKLIQSTIQNIKQPPSFVIFHSMDGSSGSGLTCLLLERLRGLFPQVHIATVSVIGFQISAPLAKYHRVICLTWLNMYADAVFLFDNEELQHTWLGAQSNASVTAIKQVGGAVKCHKRVTKDTTPSLDNLNILIRDRIRAVLFIPPTVTKNHKNGPISGPPYILPPGLGRIISQICPTRHAKILTVRVAGAVVGNNSSKMGIGASGGQMKCKWEPLVKNVVREFVSWRHKQANEVGSVDTEHV